MQEALTSLLLADAELANLVQGRVFWMRLPASVKGRPYITLQLVSDVPGYHMAGKSRLRQQVVQADIWAETYAGTEQVSGAVEAILSGFQGSFANIRFQGIFLRQSRDLPGMTTGRERQLFRRSVDFAISWNKES